MPRPDEVTFELECGASATLRVRVSGHGCRATHARCPTAAEIAGLIWLALQEANANARTPGDCDSDCDSDCEP